MKVYLVGGAVRDQLLGIPIKERDWVVVGATPEELLEKGFKKVGSDFPVFLHPQTHEEYALARTERKTGKGYLGFTCYSDPSVTLADDLKRRDLTINAIAQDSKGKIIDPYDGRQDLKNGILRHVSAAFVEDPVRILRIARFAARFGNFKVDRSTNRLMQTMLDSGEVNCLVPERVWQELERALAEAYPERFFIVLKNCKVLPKLFPEFDRHLPTIKKILKKASPLTQDSKIRFAAIAFNLERQELENFSKKQRLPNAYRDLALLAIKLKSEPLPSELKAEELITLLEKNDGYRKLERLMSALIACQINDQRFKLLIAKITAAYHSTKKIRLTAKNIQLEAPENLRKVLHNKRVKKLEQLLRKSVVANT